MLSLDLRRRWVFLASAGFWLLAPLALAQKPDPIVQLLDRDAIAAIRHPEFVSAERARIPPDERVLGVVLNGQAHAYALIDLDRHEVVDDVVGNTLIAASW